VALLADAAAHLFVARGRRGARLVDRHQAVHRRGRQGQEAEGGALEWKDGKPGEVPGSEFEMPAELVLLAMGFVSPLQSLLEEFGVERDARGNAKATTEGKGAYATSVAKVFAAGDMRRGQSLVVWAIREGRQCARAVDEFLMGFSELPLSASVANDASQCSPT
jgi:NADPH-dependent glutamate synthase beta subunit-like oxidoreductase